jgi:DNA sulfur modification protein DndC
VYTEQIHPRNKRNIILNIDNYQSTDEKWFDVVKLIKNEYLTTAQDFPWIIGFSGGKDSTLMTHAVFAALEEIPPSLRKREIHVVSNDTMVESPLVLAHLNMSSGAIRRAAESLSLPIIVARTLPDPDKTFWVLLIGKGYPSPNNQMRWCTDRLKISPTSSYIKKNIEKHQSAIILLGVRKSESNTRLKSIEKFKDIAETNLTPHTSLVGAFIFRPIVELTTDEVWEILGTYPTPWGGTHRELFQLYRDAEGGECPVVLSKDEAPGCGTNNSRFGCWTCTVVEKDRSLQGFIDSGKEIYKPLVDFRNWLVEIRNNPDYRSAIRRNGRLTFDLTGKHIPGPFTIQARRMIFAKLMATQKEFGGELITTAEIELIQKIWAVEIQTQESVANA